LQVPTNIVVPNAIRYTEARPVYVDCRLDNYNMDLELAEARITHRTKVLLIQHTFGIPVDMDAALALAARHGLILIEDCVHSLGATYDGRMVGSLGRAAFFSTEETKTITSTMGGMAVTNDPDLAARMQAFQASCPWPSARLTTRYVLRLIIYHVLTQPYVHPYVRLIYRALRRTPQTALAPQTTTYEEQRGLPPADYEQRLSNVQAVLALRQLRRLEADLVHRREVADAYTAQLLAHNMTVPSVPLKAQPAFVRYPVWVEDPAAAIRAASSYALLGEWFTSVLEEAASPAHAGYEKGSCPQAETATRHLANLPTHPRVNRSDIDAIISAVVSKPSSSTGSL
jgi:perosamine synthetase